MPTWNTYCDGGSLVAVRDVTNIFVAHWLLRLLTGDVTKKYTTWLVPWISKLCFQKIVIGSYHLRSFFIKTFSLTLYRKIYISMITVIIPKLNAPIGEKNRHLMMNFILSTYYLLWILCTQFGISIMLIFEVLNIF